MPNEDVVITDVRVYKIIDNSNNENVSIVNSAIPGSKITIGYGIESFKLNGTTMSGNSFTMPSSDVTITDVVIGDALSALINNPDYTIVDYIIGTGTQYINTGYPLWKDSNWKMEFKFDVTQHYNYNNMFGFLDATDTNNEIWIDSGAGYYFRVGGISKTKIFTVELNTPYTIIHDNTGSNLLNYVNGNLVSTLNRANTASNYNLGFGHRAGGYYLKGKIYYLKFWSNGVLVRNMVPVVNSDGVAGLYDLVDSVFYTNAGSGNFTVPS